VLVNAASVKEGGPLVVLNQLITHMRELRSDIDWAMAIHPSVRLPQDRGCFSQVDVGNMDSSPFGMLRWYEASLPGAIAQHRSDLVFSITNYLSLHGLTVPTVLLVQHAGHFSKKFDELNRRHLRRLDRIAAWRFKTRWVEHSVRRASEVTVQTAALADAVAVRTGRARKSIHVIPHGPGTVAPTPGTPKDPRGRAVRIGYVTKWGVQKNFEVLFAAISCLADKGRNIRLVVTLDQALRENAHLLQQAKAAGLSDRLENAGEVDSANISTLYESLDIFVFPSLVESFGFPLVEAMTKGLPIVAADTPSNREIVADAGFYFAPSDVSCLTHLLGDLIDNATLRIEKSAASIRRARQFSWPRAAEQTLALFDKVLGATRTEPQ
jgi:glycosyltransferase involved in cell wall biosynthesis